MRRIMHGWLIVGLVFGTVIYAVAEDVVMPPRGDSSPWSVKGVRWAGGFFTSVGGFRILPTVGIPMDFVILFYADAGGEPTGSPLDCFPGTAIAARLVATAGRRLATCGEAVEILGLPAR